MARTSTRDGGGAYLLLDGSRPMTGDLDMNNHNITNLGDITDSFDLGDGLNDMLILPVVNWLTKKVYLGNSAKTLYQANIYKLVVGIINGVISLPFAATNSSFLAKDSVTANVAFSTLYGGIQTCARLVSSASNNGMFDLIRAGGGNLPVADPADGFNKLWNNAGVVTVGT